MVRRAASLAKSRYVEVDEDDGEDSYSDAGQNYDDDSDIEELPIKKRKPKPLKRKTPAKSPRGKISPSKKPASRYVAAAAAASPGRPRKNNVSYTYDSASEEDEASVEEVASSDDYGPYEDDDDDEDYYSSKRRASPAKKSPGKKGRGRPPASASSARQPSRSPAKAGRGRPPAAKAKKNSATPKDNFPPIAEMVIDSIKALKDNPKKGSTLGSIKETIMLNWPVNMKVYDVKIKKFLTKALETGDVVQTKGKGFRGRFTVPGMKVKRRKKPKSSLSKKFDEDELEYKAKKTTRDEAREKNQEELEQRRLDRQLWEERKAAEKADKPKRAPVVRKQEYEVEAIKGVRKRKKDEKTLYLVKFVGYPKPQWEPEENVADCHNILEEFLAQEEERQREDEERRKREEEDGAYEVARIQDVKFKKDKKREFLIRWKGHGPEDDSWEPEENLDCPNLIEKFMGKWEKVVLVSDKSLREAPKRVERLNFASSHRVSKRNQGFRVTYEDMDE